MSAENFWRRRPICWRMRQTTPALFSPAAAMPVHELPADPVVTNEGRQRYRDAEEF
jgi:hypothetical protein